jgi:hypothetical protein
MKPQIYVHPIWSCWICGQHNLPGSHSDRRKYVYMLGASTQHIHVFAMVAGREQKRTTSPPSYNESTPQLAFHHKISNSYYIPEHRTSVFVAQGAHAPSLVVNGVREYLDEHSNQLSQGRSMQPSKAPEPSFDSIVQTGKLFYASTHIYVTESLRIDAILNPLSRLLGAELEHSVKAPKEGTYANMCLRRTLVTVSRDHC